MIDGPGQSPLRLAKWRPALVRILSGESDRFWGLCGLVPEMVLLAGFVVFFEWLKHSSALPQDYYQTSLVAGSFGKFILENGLLTGASVVLILAVLFSRKIVGLRWEEIEHGVYVRIVIGAAAVAVAWPLAFSNINLLTGEHYWIDRALILLCVAALYFRPFAVFPLLLFATPMIWMQDAGIGTFSWEFYGMPLRILAVFFVWLLLFAGTGILRTAPLFFVMVCIIAGHYWIPGNSKLRTGWLLYNHIFYLHPSAYANGWLGFLEPATITRIANFLSIFNIPMKIGAVALECGSLFILLGKRRTVLFFLIGFTAFHLAILLISGIFIWQWMFVDAAIVLIIWRGRHEKELLRFRRWHIFASILIICLAPYWLRSARLSWFDTPVNYVLRFEAITEDGVRGNLAPQFFAPFDTQFTFSAFRYLVQDQPLLDITWGATSRSTATGLKDAVSVEDVFAYEAEHGSIRYNGERIEHMRKFLQCFVGNYNRRPNQVRSIPWVSPPPSLITFPRDDNFVDAGPIRTVEVTHITSYFDEEGYREIRQLPVMRVEIPVRDGAGI